MRTCSTPGCVSTVASLKASLCRKHRNQYMREYHRRPEVREKRKRDHFLVRYGLTPEQLAELRDSQNNICKTCGADGPLFVDHDHSTNTVRGLLCPNCNFALGHAQDDPGLLRVLANYLEGV